MSIFKKIASSGKYQDDNAIHDVISYILRSSKTPSDFIGGVSVDENDIAGSMVKVSEAFGKNSNIRLHHFIVSFCPREIYSRGVLICIAEEISSYIGREHQIVYALHEDSYYPHLHFVFNAVSYIDGHRYRGGKREYHDLVNLTRRVVRSYGVAELTPVNYYPRVDNPHE